MLHRAGKRASAPPTWPASRWGLERGYDVLVEMDADGSHQPEELPRLLDALERADLVLGSRWVPGGRVVNWPRRREFLSRGGNLYSRLALGVRLRDVTGGYRAFRAETLRDIDLTRSPRRATASRSTWPGARARRATGSSRSRSPSSSASAGSRR